MEMGDGRWENGTQKDGEILYSRNTSMCAPVNLASWVQERQLAKVDRRVYCTKDEDSGPPSRWTRPGGWIA